MICRICLEKSQNTMAIFAEENSHLKIAEIVNKHLWVKPLPDDSMSTAICEVCWLKICDFHRFFESVQNVQSTYLLHLENNTANVEGMVLNIKVEIDDKLQEQVMEIEKPCLETNIANDIEEQKNPLDDDSELKPKDDLSDASNDINLLNAGETESSSDGECLAMLQDKNRLSRKKGSRKPFKRNKKPSTETKPKTPKAKTDQTLIENLINKHIPMACSLCVFMGQKFSDIVQHFRSIHPKQKPFVMCCERKLSKRYYLSQHALKHENPEHFKCHECQKTFSSNRGLRAHNLAYHASEEQKLYACEICPQRFATKHLLDLHQPAHISREERSFFCTKCPTKRAFASEYLLAIHNSMRHNRETNVCHVCAKAIRDKRSFEKHVRLHFEDSGPRVKCPYPDCESWLKDEENLKLHLKHHNPEGIIYKCTECGKSCKSRVALASHKRYSHSNETFPCEQCGKTFKKALTLKEHMAQHTGETLYKCPFCTRTFNSNANMHAHKKKMHPKEWDEWRKSKRGSSQLLISHSSSIF